MKSFIYLIISILLLITMTSALQKTSDGTKSITLQAAGNNVTATTLKQSADIISNRLKQYGLSTSEVKISADKGQLKVLLPEKTDIAEIEGLLTSKGELAFYETYTSNEIAGLLKPDNQLFKLLNHDIVKSLSDPRVGCTGTENIKKTDEYLKSAAPVKDCKLFWGHESKKSGYCLFALKTDEDGRPLLVQSDVESVKMATDGDNKNPKIQIKLKAAVINVFAEATKSNMNKSIAIVIDDRVYAWPVVKSEIKGGEIEVTGSFTENEANYFPAIFNSERLPLSFKILK